MTSLTIATCDHAIFERNKRVITERDVNERKRKLVPLFMKKEGINDNGKLEKFCRINEFIPETWKFSRCRTRPRGNTRHQRRLCCVLELKLESDKELKTLFLAKSIETPLPQDIHFCVEVHSPLPRVVVVAPIPDPRPSVNCPNDSLSNRTLPVPRPPSGTTRG